MPPVGQSGGNKNKNKWDPKEAFVVEIPDTSGRPSDHPTNNQVRNFQREGMGSMEAVLRTRVRLWPSVVVISNKFKLTKMTKEEFRLPVKMSTQRT